MTASRKIFCISDLIFDLRIFVLHEKPYWQYLLKSFSRFKLGQIPNLGKRGL